MRFTNDLPITELHDADRIGRLAVIREHVLRHPEIPGADDPSHGKPFLVGLRRTRCLDVAPPADALAGLRILKHGVVAIDLVLFLEIVSVRGGPMPVESVSDCSPTALRLGERTSGRSPRLSWRAQRDSKQGLERCVHQKSSLETR